MWFVSSFSGKSVDAAGVVAVAGPELAIGAAEEEETLCQRWRIEDFGPLDIVRPALHLQEELLVVALARNGALDAPGLHDALARAQDVHIVLAVAAKPYPKVPVGPQLTLDGAPCHGKSLSRRKVRPGWDTL